MTIYFRPKIKYGPVCHCLPPSHSIKDNQSLSNMNLSHLNSEYERHCINISHLILALSTDIKLSRFVFYRQRFQKICNGEIYVPGMTVMKDITFVKTRTNENGERVINKIQRFENDDVLFEYCKLPQVRCAPCYLSI